MSRGKIALSILVALIVAFGIGYGWGSSGRSPIEDALSQSRLQLDLAEARGHLLDARVSLFNVNFGDASKHFEEAKTPLGSVRDRLQKDGDRDAAAKIGTALDQIAEAQKLAAKLDQTANAKAGEALETIKLAMRK
ncbi:MAG TPA: hypothetical protein VHI99_07720 [Vicinamibacterales bacterium]|jgi:hypothetical protein|nr:hypothetical protein [Vicinamibacterales bacterium]